MKKTRVHFETILKRLTITLEVKNFIKVLEKGKYLFRHNEFVTEIIEGNVIGKGGQRRHILMISNILCKKGSGFGYERVVTTIMHRL